MLRSTEYDLALFNETLKFFSVDVSPLLESQEIKRDDDTWKHLLTLAHLGVYLADLCQDFGRTSQWEEYRIFFARLIKEWNKDSVKERHLYEAGDLKTNNYLDSFPGRLSPLDSLENMVRRLLYTLYVGRPIERIWKSVVLNLRGSRFIRRHDIKAVGKLGLEIKEKGTWKKFNWGDELPEVYEAVRAYSKRRLIY